MDLRLAFDEVPELYDRLRPTYVTELYKKIFDYSGIGSGSRVLEIGIGTGQATLPFLEEGIHVTAIELGENLSAFTKEKLKGYEKFEIINTAFEDYECVDESYDLIYSASAFHWIPEEIGYSKVFRLLKSGGVFARFANHPFKDKRNEQLHLALQDLYKKFMPHISLKNIKEYSAEDANERSDICIKYGFVNPEYKLYHRIRTLDSENYAKIIRTFSDHRAAGEEKLDFFCNKTKEAVNDFGGIINIYDTIDLQLARKP